MSIVDTDILVDILRGHGPAVEWLDSLDKPPVVPGFSVLELYAGCANRAQARVVTAMIARFEVVWPSAEDYIRVLRVYPELALAHGVGEIDVLIASCALGLGATLLTFNIRHFRVVPDLRVEQPYSRTEHKQP